MIFHCVCVCVLIDISDTKQSCLILLYRNIPHQQLSIQFRIGKEYSGNDNSKSEMIFRHSDYLHSEQRKHKVNLIEYHKPLLWFGQFTWIYLVQNQFLTFWSI